MDGFGRSMYETVYDNGLKNGFKDTDVWHYFTSHGEDAEVRCETPFTYNGEKLTGFAVVPLVHVGRDTLRDSNTRELYLGKRNMEDVAAKATDSCDYMVVDSRTGKSITRDEALDEMGKFCAAVSEYPHVEVAGEWFRKRQANFLIHDKEYKPNPEDFRADYFKYIGECIQKMKDGTTYVGSRKTPEEVFDENGSFVTVNERYQYYHPQSGYGDEYHRQDMEKTLNAYVSYVKNHSIDRGQLVDSTFEGVTDEQIPDLEEDVVALPNEN